MNSVLKQGAGCVERIIVVDNGSTDGSDNTVKGLSGVEVVCAGKNLGFAAACNLGAAKASAPYILFLNPDTRIGEDSLSTPLSFMERPENADIGICGIQLVDERGEVSRTCARFPTLGRFTAQAFGLDKFSLLKHMGVQMKDWNHSHTSEVAHVIGAFFFIRRSLFESLDGFDERFFVYLEDLDLSLRAQTLGFKSVYLSDIQAYHAGGGASKQVKNLRLFYSLRSRLLYGFKHFPSWQAWMLTGVTMIIEPFCRLFYCAMSRDWEGMKNTLHGYRYLWGNVPQILAIDKKRTVL